MDPSSSRIQDLSNVALLHLFRHCAHLQHQGRSPRGRTRILTTLLESGPITQRALANLVERTPATLSQQLEPLEKASLVERTPVPEDRRTVTVRLTPAGEEAAREAQADRERVANELFGGLSSEDRHELARLLTMLESQWRQRSQGEGDVR